MKLNLLTTRLGLGIRQLLMMVVTELSLTGPGIIDNSSANPVLFKGEETQQTQLSAGVSARFTFTDGIPGSLRD